MKKLAFIIPYFGTLPTIFPFFLKSCEYNNTIDFLLYTDDQTNYDYPTNVKVKYCDFSWMQQQIKKSFDNLFQLHFPYKLCDYKPAYGYIFQNDLKNYDYWGHCDLDAILGDIRTYIDPYMEQNEDKIFEYGHMTIYRNDYDVNSRFMLTFNGRERYQEVYLSSESCSFDEEFKESINSIYLEHGYSFIHQEYMANIFTKANDFRLTWWNYSSEEYEIEAKSKSFFAFVKGHLYRYVLQEGTVCREEYIYIHMQGRKMKCKTDVAEAFLIVPNAFSAVPDALHLDNCTLQEFNQVKKHYFTMHYIRHRSKNLWIKIRRKVVSKK